MKTLVLLAAGAASLLACLNSETNATVQEAAPAMAARSPGVARFDDDGVLQRPRGYRRWVYVGAPLTPNDMNDGAAAFPEFHSVYVDPASFDGYKRTGSWPDGTVVLKELVSVGGKSAASGKGYFMGDFLGLEAMVKDSARFPDEPGNWGFFRFTDEDGGPPRRVAEVLPRTACAACHVGSAEDDLVFTQHYPVLRAAKGFGAGDPEDR